MFGKRKCVHNVNRKDTSILLLDKFTTSVPSITYGVCKYCQKSFEFISSQGKEEVFNDVDDRGDKSKAQ